MKKKSKKAAVSVVQLNQEDYNKRLEAAQKLLVCAQAAGEFAAALGALGPNDDPRLAKLRYMNQAVTFYLAAARTSPDVNQKTLALCKVASGARFIASEMTQLEQTVEKNLRDGVSIAG